MYSKADVNSADANEKTSKVMEKWRKGTLTFHLGLYEIFAPMQNFGIWGKNFCLEYCDINIIPSLSMVRMTDFFKGCIKSTRHWYNHRLRGIQRSHEPIDLCLFTRTMNKMKLNKEGYFTDPCQNCFKKHWFHCMYLFLSLCKKSSKFCFR